MAAATPGRSLACASGRQQSFCSISGQIPRLRFGKTAVILQRIMADPSLTLREDSSYSAAYYGRSLAYASGRQQLFCSVLWIDTLLHISLKIRTGSFTALYIFFLKYLKQFFLFAKLFMMRSLQHLRADPSLTLREDSSHSAAYPGRSAATIFFLWHRGFYLRLKFGTLQSVSV